MFPIKKINEKEFKKILNKLQNLSINELFHNSIETSILVLMKNEEEMCCLFSNQEKEIDYMLDEDWKIDNILLFKTPRDSTIKEITKIVEYNIDDNEINNISILLYEKDFGKIYTLIEDVFMDRELDSNSEELEDDYIKNMEDMEDDKLSDKYYNDEDIEDYERQGVYIADYLAKNEDEYEENNINDNEDEEYYKRRNYEQNYY